MDSRERVLTAVAHEEPDRPPVFATYTPEVEQSLKDYYKISDDKDVGVEMGNDMVKVQVGMENSFYMCDDPVYTCPFGVVWKNVKNSSGAYTEIIDGPLRNDTDGSKLEKYQIPNPDDPKLYEHVKTAVDRFGKEKIIIGSCQCSIFETSWYLMGLDAFLEILVCDEDYANTLLDKVMQFPLRAGLNMIELGVDMVWLGDDVATQLDMMISMPMWRKYLKGRYAYIFEQYKKANPNIKIAYHGCGNCERFIDEMVEIGLDILQPIQPQAMNPYKIKERYGKKVTMFGGLDIQDLFPNGTVNDIRQTVRDYKKYLGAGGGYIISPAHHLQSDTSAEKIGAFYDESMKPVKYDYKYVK